MQIMTYTQKNQVNWVINQGLGVGVGSRESGVFWGKGVGSRESVNFNRLPTPKKKGREKKQRGENKKRMERKCTPSSLMIKLKSNSK